MKKLFKILGIIVGSIVGIFAGLLLAYIIVNRQGVIEPFEVGSPTAEQRILIASQGSDFKEALLADLVEQVKGDDRYLYVIDCTHLTDEYQDQWDAIVVIHAAQIHRMPKQARAFMDKLPDLSKAMLVSTSGAGDDRVEGLEVDAITTASRTRAIEPVLAWVVPKVEDLLVMQSMGE